MFLANGLDHISPEQPGRVSTFTTSTYRYVPLMQGTSEFVPQSRDGDGVFLDTLPRPGNCATGGCGDAYSPKPCGGEACGCATPGTCNPPSPVTSNPQLAFSSTDCTVEGEECSNWLSFHNCNPDMPLNLLESRCNKQ